MFKVLMLTLYTMDKINEYQTNKSNGKLESQKTSHQYESERLHLEHAATAAFTGR